ncbi:MAG: MBL fold metallo-hydrolase [Clostridia bacterium]|nr:MBL fold metallo-hydrolase [Clostridia bacterium]
MNRKKILFSLIAALLALAAILCGCGKEPAVPVDTSDPAGTTEDTTSLPEKNSFVLMEGGQPLVKIVRSDSLTTGESQVTVARNVLNALGQFGNVNSSLITDWSKDGTHDPDAPEILIGSVNYEESAEVAKDLKYNEYEVRVVGSKIVVFGYSDTAVAAAANDLIRKIKRAGNSELGSVELTYDEISFKGSLSGILGKIPHYDGGTIPIIYDPGDDCQEVIVRETDIDGYRAYLDKLKGLNYTVRGSHDIGANSFATLVDGEYMINAGYYDYEKSVRIIIEDYKQASIDALGDGTGTRVTSAQITMLGLGYPDSTNNGAEKTNGLSIIIRLEDGRFIVVDGGFNRVAQADLLINTIKSQSADYRSQTGMKVAAWIVTHSHGDHMGMISKQYSKLHNAGIEVENFLINFMSDSERQRSINYYLAKNAGNWTSTEGSSYTTVYAAARALGSNPVVAHVGQVYRYLGLDLEVLYTIESHGPKMAAALNTTSLIMKFNFTDTLTGKKTTYLSTGDATGDGFEISAKCFGDYLHCDLLQIAHHGGTTWGNDSGTIKAYKLVAPSTLVWPCGASYWPTAAKKSYNVGVQNTSSNPNYKETLVAGVEGTVTVFPLPYSVGSAVQTPPAS